MSALNSKLFEGLCNQIDQFLLLKAPIMLAYLIFAITAIVVLLAAIIYLYPVSKKVQTYQWQIQGGGGRQGRAPLGPNSFIFMQFSAKVFAK